METIDISMIQEKSQRLARKLNASLTEKGNQFTFSKGNSFLGDILCEDDFVLLTINVSDNEERYEDLHQIFFSEWIPELIGCHKETVKKKIVYRDMDETEEVTIKGHRVEFHYGFNYITFKIYRKEV